MHTLVQPAAPEVVGDDDVRDGVKDELDVLCICGASHVAINFLGGRLIFSFKLSLKLELDNEFNG